jgi:hypothetical protein
MKKNKEKLSKRADAFIGETVQEYNTRIRALERMERELTGGKTLDQETDDFLQKALDAII